MSDGAPRHDDPENDFAGADTPRLLPPAHYYGDEVRQLFMLAGAIMIICLPFVKDLVNMPFHLLLLGAIIINILAGFTNPRSRVVAGVDFFISIIGIFIFESFAVEQGQSSGWLFFIFNQVMALIFFGAMYLSGKTLRGLRGPIQFPKPEPKEEEDKY